MKGITFNGKHSYKDMNLMIHSIDIGDPVKIKRKGQVPYSNVEYDFSLAYGGQQYSHRPITVVFTVFNSYNPTNTKNVWERVAAKNWLVNTNGKTKLTYDGLPGYYFLAEVENEFSYEDNYTDGLLTVPFHAYPFMIGERKEGNNIWEHFNFHTDVLQDVDFEINGTKEVTLINAGIPNVVPEVVSSGEMTIRMRNQTFVFPSGNSKSDDFFFVSGKNLLTIEGNGTIEFNFYKELI